MTEQQVIDAIKQGVRRARCELVSCQFTPRHEIEIRVRKSQGEPIQIGMEYIPGSWSERELSERVRRFAEHYCLKRPYVLRWGDSLV